MIKKWVFKNNDTNELAKNINDKLDVGMLASIVLSSRGYTVETAYDFLKDDIEVESPQALLNIEIAVNRILQAVEMNEKIAVYGDYDCDGVTATAILYNYLSSIGADVLYYIPKREGEGYGINMQSVKKLYDMDVNLIITVDNGISAVEESIYIKELNMDLIITDHHKPSSRLPTALCIINPHIEGCSSSFKPLCGAGVAFKLVTALEGYDYTLVTEQFSDILSLGTVADVVPLTGENRVFVKNGLQQIKSGTNIGISAILRNISVNQADVNARTIAYMIAPRINAAGRMGDANLALEALICDDPDLANDYAIKLNELNSKRQEIEKKVLYDIHSQIEENPLVLNNRALIFYGDDWHHGVVGIVASKIMEAFLKPVFLMSLKDNILTGSARSFSNISIFNILDHCKEHLIKYGGHQNAGGFSLHIDNFEGFYKSVLEYLKNTFDLLPSLTQNVDAALSGELLNIEQIKKLKTLEPFGQNNPLPMFLLSNAVIVSITPLSNDKHLKIQLKIFNKIIQALYFNISSTNFIFNVNDCCDIIGTIEVNTYLNNESIVFKINDIRPSNLNQDKMISGQSYYEKYKNNEEINQKLLEKMYITKKECSSLYKYLLQFKDKNISIDNLYFPLHKSQLNFCKYRLIIDIFCELKFIKLSFDNSINFLPANKTPLEQSMLFTKLNKE